MVRKMENLRILKIVKKVIKGTNAGSIPEFNPIEDSKKWGDFQLDSPVSQEMNLEIDRH